MLRTVPSISLATLLSVTACQGAVESGDPEPRGLVLEHASSTRITALYETEEVTLRIDARVSDGEITSRVAWADGRLLTTLDMPDSMDAIGPLLASHVRAGAVASGPRLDRDGGAALAVYGPMMRDLFVATEGLGELPLRYALIYHEGVVAAHQWSSNSVLADDDECDIHDGDVPWHTRWMHPRIGELATFDSLEPARAEGEDPYLKLCIAFLSECCYTLGCYLHDAACVSCGSFLCGGDCTVGTACMGRCGGGCGNC